MMDILKGIELANDNCRKLAFSLILGCQMIFLCYPATSDQDPGDLYDPPSGSSWMNLAKLPPMAALMEKAGLKTSNEIVKRNFEKQYGKLVEQTRKVLEGSEYGALIEVSIYADEFGMPSVPGAQFLVSVGVGTEPLDALAEFERNKSYRMNPAKNWKDQRYFLWIKEEKGEMKGAVLPREATRGMEIQAKKEAKRRNRLAKWEKAMPTGGLKSFQRSAFWSEVSDKHSKHITDNERRSRALVLVEKFKLSEQEFNKLYKDYQKVEEEIRKNSSRKDTLSALLEITKLFKSAVEAGEVLFSEEKNSKLTPDNHSQSDTLDKQSGGSGKTGVESPKKQIKTDDKPNSDLEAEMSYTRKQIDYYSGRAQELSVKMKIKGGELQELDTKIKDVFKSNNVPIPKNEHLWNIPGQEKSKEGGTENVPTT